MSPDSDVAAYARTLQRDIDDEHRRLGERVKYITRPPMFCVACGAAVEQRIFGPIRREVWCGALKCPQYGKRLNVFDPVLDGEPHA